MGLADSEKSDSSSAAAAAAQRNSPGQNGQLDSVDLEVPVQLKPVATGRASQSVHYGGDDEIFDQTERESKLELFEIDSLVDIVGLKSMGGQQPAQPYSPRAGEEIAITLGRPRPRGAKLGTLMGVFVPCLQNILGIIFYIRFSWIVGIAGIGQSLLLVSLCCLCTFLTGISLSAIATNGAMKGGGPYYLIGRALGPEVGVSIGLCFFLGNAVAGSLYILGAVETFLDALPGAGIFRESTTHLAPSAAGSVPGILSVVAVCLCFRIVASKLVRTSYYLFNLLHFSFCRDLLGLFFPAVTGIMAGSNRSASLKDTQRSIPVGTLSAIGSTTVLYLISAIMFGFVAKREELLTNRLLTATLAWPVPTVVQVGIILSTLGAALQSLTGAPRLLAAISNDNILPVLKYFKAPDGVEPHLATLFTMFICASCVIIGDLDLISPAITMFFLLCYAGVNLSCLLLDLLDAPSWRPRCKFHHWSFQTRYVNGPTVTV